MAFRGTRVFISRNLLPPDLILTLHDALRDNGAEVCFCCNPSCNSSTDYHVLISPESEMFGELQAQGCQIVGPQCILRCAKERRALPKQMYTCCLAMEGFHVLTTGFTTQEKAKIEQLVSSMGGVCDANVSATLSCVIAKNVLTPKYKLTSSLRKPVVSIDWLYQCWREHRIVPFEPYRLLPFTGLTICATQIPADMRSKISEAAEKSGGSYSADLTRICTHLIANLPEGDKYKVAKRWGTVKLVNQQWFWQSIAAKACLDEDLYPVRGEDVAGMQKINARVQQSLSSPLESEFSSLLPATACTPSYVSNTCGQDQTFQSGCLSENKGVAFSEEAPVTRAISNIIDEAREYHGPDDMYLSECRIHLVGFESNDLRRLVNMVSDGGGTRYVEFNETVTHVIVGQPSESESKDIRQVAVWGALSVVSPRWLEDCTKHKREVPVRKEHCVFEASAFKGNAKVGGPIEESRFCNASSGRVFAQAFSTSSVTTSLMNGKPCSSSEKAVFVGSESIWDQEDTRESHNQCSSRVAATMDRKAAMKEDDLNLQKRLLPEKRLETAKVWPDGKENLSGVSGNPCQFHVSKQAVSSANDKLMPRSGILQQSVSLAGAVSDILFKPEEVHSKLEELKGSQTNLNCLEDLPMQDSNLFPPVLLERAENIAPNTTNIFGGLTFGFTVSFPLNRRDEIIEWVVLGGGKIEGPDSRKEPDFLVALHGSGPTYMGSKSKLVSSHWIKFCLNEKKLLDIQSHILYSPLQCFVPLPGFGVLKICVSQYEEKDRLLLRNLCYVLGAKFTEVLNKKVTHLLCKVRDGQKYQAALTWGINVVTAEWLYQCVAQNAMVSLSTFYPKNVSADQLEAGTFAVTQFPTQAAQLAVGELNSQWVTQKESMMKMRVQGLENQVAARTKQRKNHTKEHATGHGKRLSNSEKNRQIVSKVATKGVRLGSVNHLDPWDELTATWSTQAPSEDRVTERPKHNESILKDETLSGGVQVKSNPTENKAFESGPLVIEDVELRSQRHQGDQASSDQSDKEKFLKCTSDNVGMDRINDATKLSDESGHQVSDVAAAIEDLLAQTSKVKVKDASTTLEVSEDLLCSDSTAISRRNIEEPLNHSKFKRPKPWGQRSIEVEEEPKVLSNSSPQDVYDRFQDSQLDSQVVGYDEDHSGRLKIMERVRTRSMSVNSPGISGGLARKNDRITTWKNNGFGRLFKAAEANKQLSQNVTTR
ncbi:hypothetical protein O6H91_Y168400 [Diphasiastrum complanatum]|nr:hypothetical protein O6H91_Y291100 [Diphasiastrum complanatum]KAJ7300324.1 hypothetical protein O6H91_Y168400 [Diphasiastrum complanatum]